MENAQNKGMSKGCLIGLIVVAAIVVLILIGLATCWFYKDDLAKMAAGTLVNGLKAELVTREYDGVDTVHFNLAADAFLQRLEAEDPLNFEAYSIFMSSLQSVMQDKTFDAEEIPAVLDAFILYFPELEEFRLPEEEEQPLLEEDSLSTE